jgi:hypothetical protein
VKAKMRVLVSLLIGAGPSVLAPDVSWAGHPVQLTDGQMDHVTAGGAIVISSADAQAAGVFNLANTTSNSFVAGGVSPYPGQPGLSTNAGAADGTALAVGTNLGVQGEPPTSSGTNVSTAGAAEGNQVITSTVNQTVHGVGGVTFQAGWTVVYGAWVGL